MNDQSKGALKPTNTGVSVSLTMLCTQAAKAIIACLGGVPVLASCSSENPLISRALGSAFPLMGCNSQEKTRVTSSTSQAPIERRLYLPGIGPDVSTSMEMKTSRLLVMI